MIKDVMVRLDGSPDDEARLAAANAIAKQFDSHVIGLFLNELPLLLVEEGDSQGGVESVRLIEKARAHGDRMEARLAARLAQLRKPVELRRFDTFGNTMAEIAQREARSADVFIAICPDNSTREPDQLIESVLFGTGRHLFLTPRRKSEAAVFDHVMVAWNASRESTRAVAEALPYLSKAETVSVVVVDEEPSVEDQALIGNDLIEHLQHHGIAAELRHVRKDGGVASTLIAECKRLKPDLVVMGGYGHSRLREWLLGGATYEMIHKTPAPLVIAH